MRKGLNKKGFSLVELMIVVVIMGILVAVAIPLYGAITENAEKKTCRSNQENIRAVFAKYCVEDGNHTASTLLPSGSYSNNAGSTDEIDPDFVASFADGFPKCPVEGHYYVITKTGNYEISITCCDKNGSPDAKHNASAG